MKRYARLQGIGLFSLLVGSAASSQAQRTVERWVSLGAAEIQGQTATFAIDDTWPRSTGLIRSAHWQIILDAADPAGVKDLRMIDRVDCGKSLRANVMIERYDEAGRLISRKETSLGDIHWQPMGKGIAAEADGFACIDGPPNK